MKKMIYLMGIAIITLSSLSDAEVKRISGSPENHTLVEFGKPSTSGTDFPPSMEKYVKVNRIFVAKMDSFGMDRYFTFENQDDMKQLLKAVHDGGGWDVTWYYYDA